MERWRLIFDGPSDGVTNMAVDEAVLRAAETGLFPPTLRFYEWSSPTVSTGYLQSVEPFKNLTIPVVRRVTGGRAVLHDIELTYSVVTGAQSRLFSEGIHGAYSAISRCIVKTLKAVGVNASLSRPSRGVKMNRKDFCFSAAGRHEIVVGGKKIVGSSQRRLKRAFLQHGSILFNVDCKMLDKVFGPSSASSVAWVGQYSEVTKEKFARLLARDIERGLDIELTEGVLADEERGFNSIAV